MVEDDFADFFGQLCFTLSADRLDRGLWLLKGLPWLAMAALHSDEIFNKLIDVLAEIFAIFE